MEFVTLCPGFVVGPHLNRSMFTSADVIIELMRGEFPELYGNKMPFVDIRDVCQAHINAITQPNVENTDLHEMSSVIDSARDERDLQPTLVPQAPAQGGGPAQEGPCRGMCSERSHRFAHDPKGPPSAGVPRCPGSGTPGRIPPMSV